MLGTEVTKTKDKKGVVSALSTLSMERQEMETVKIWNVSSADLGVCVRSRGMREVSKERAAWEHSLEKHKKVLMGRRRGEKGADSSSSVCAKHGAWSSWAGMLDRDTVTVPDGQGP